MYVNKLLYATKFVQKIEEVRAKLDRRTGSMHFLDLLKFVIRFICYHS